jgi:hypothetical protein
MGAGGTRPVASPGLVRAFRTFFAGNLVLFALVAVVIFALQLPSVTFLLTFLVVELAVGAAYSVAMSFVVRRVKKRESTDAKIR